jgi:hypothetical protein
MVQPIMERQTHDRVRLEGMNVHIENLSDRIEAIEVIYNMRAGKNVMLDTMTDRLNEVNIRLREANADLFNKIMQHDELLSTLTIATSKSQHSSEIAVSKTLIITNLYIEKRNEAFQNRLGQVLSVLLVAVERPNEKFPGLPAGAIQAYFSQQKEHPISKHSS